MRCVLVHHAPTDENTVGSLEIRKLFGVSCDVASKKAAYQNLFSSLVESFGTPSEKDAPGGSLGSDVNAPIMLVCVGKYAGRKRMISRCSDAV